MPVGYEEMPEAPGTTASTEEVQTGLWRTLRPVIDYAKCTKCLLCWKFCPDGVIAVLEDSRPEIDLYHCKGCGICANECPPKCIAMVREEEP